MIPSLYKIFQHWAEKGSVFILSDTHFADDDCLLMDRHWISPELQVQIINEKVHKNDTFVCLGDVGDPSFAAQIRAGYKVLLLGNHDRKKLYHDIFDEIYDGPLFIGERILLSHEPVEGLSWCVNIHGHDHSGSGLHAAGCKHINLAANVCGYVPVSLGRMIKDGLLADVTDIHRMTIDAAIENPLVKT